LRSPDNTIAGARAFEQLVRRTLADTGRLDDLDPARRRTRLTFAEFADRWMRDYVQVNNKPSEVEKKRHVLRRTLLPRFGAMGLRDITTHSIEHFKSTLCAAALSPKSVNNQLAILRRALVLAVEWGELEVVPRVRFLKTVQRPARTLALEDIDRLAAAASSEFWRAFIVVTGYTGARFNEVIALEWGDIDIERTPASITISRGAVRGHVGATKTYGVRSVPLPLKALHALRELPRLGPRVFDYGGELVPYNTARKELRRTAARAGLEPMGWHTLRHTYVTELARRGAPLHTVQRLAGHSTIQTTMRYAHVLPEMLVSAVQLLEDPAEPPRAHEREATGGQETRVRPPPAHDRDSAPRASQTQESRLDGRLSTWSG